MGVLGVGVVGHEVAGGEECGEGRRTTRGEIEREKKGMVEERESEARLVVLFVALLFFFSLSTSTARAGCFALALSLLQLLFSVV